MYALVVTIAAGVLLLALLGGAVVLARGVAAGGGLPSIRGWRWFPSPLALLIVVPVVALLAWRALPVLLVLPFVLPFFLRGRRRGTVFFMGRERPRRNGGNGTNGTNGTIEGERRPSDENRGA